MKFRKSTLAIVLLLGSFVGLLNAQTPYGQPLSQSVTVSTVAVPVNTPLLGSGLSCTGSAGSFSANTYVVAYTYTGLQTSSESKASSDGGSTLTTLVVCPANGTLTIPSPPSPPSCANCVGWRPYVIASSSGTGAELLQTITAANCVLASTSALTACAIGQSFTETSLGAGAAEPSNPALFTPNGTGGTTFGAYAPLFESGLGIQTHYLSWVTTGTAATCTIAVQTSPDNVTYTTLGTAQTCTSSGFYVVSGSAAVFFRVNLTAFTATGANVPSIAFTLLEGANTVPSYVITDCGTTTTCTPNATLANTIIKVVYGLCTLSSNSCTVASIVPAFSATTSYQCTVTDQTTAQLVKVVNTSASSITISDTVGASDVVSYVCVGT